MSNIKICSRCVMDESADEIEFDEEGVCNFCKEYEDRVKNEMFEDKEKALKELVIKIKEEGKDKPYDCIIGVSGGVDSSFVAHIVKEHGLRPLAIHLDNGWNSELAVSNIEKLLNQLDIELYTHVVNWNEFKDLQKSFIKSSLRNLEIPTDHAIGALLLQMANRYNIRYILNGSNLVTEGILPLSWVGRNIDHRLLTSVHKEFGTQKLKTYPSVRLTEFAYYILVKKIKYIPFLNYVEYNKEDAISFLEERYGWRRYAGKHFESIFTRFYQGYMFPEKYGIDKRKAHLSTLIMSGQMSRDDAKQELLHSPYGEGNENLIEEDIEYVLKKLDFTKEEFDKIMKERPKKTTDYSSSDFLFDGLKPYMNRLKKIAKRA